METHNHPEVKEVEKPKRILEVGCGTQPYFEIFGNDRPKNSTYLGIDLQEDWFKVLKQKHPELDLAIINARSLPFPDETFDTVVLNSILGGPDDSWYLNKKDEVDIAGKKWDILQEAFRVLKVAGRLKIFEMYGIVYEDVFFKDLMHIDEQKQILKRVSQDNDLDAFYRQKTKSIATGAQRLGFVFEKISHQKTENSF